MNELFDEEDEFQPSVPVGFAEFRGRLATATATAAAATATATATPAYSLPEQEERDDAKNPTPSTSLQQCRLSRGRQSNSSVVRADESLFFEVLSTSSSSSGSDDDESSDDESDASATSDRSNSNAAQLETRNNAADNDNPAPNPPRATATAATTKQGASPVPLAPAQSAQTGKAPPVLRLGRAGTVGRSATTDTAVARKPHLFAANANAPQRVPVKRRREVDRMSTHEVHSLLVDYWKRQDGAEIPFQRVRVDALTPEERNRYHRLVNVDNWNGPRENDLLLPLSLFISAAPSVPVAPHTNTTERSEPSINTRSLGEAQVAETTASARGASAAADGARTTTAAASGIGLKLHQVSGIRYMWRMLAQGPVDSVPGIGCVLAHSMGLGKTCQVVCFLHMFFRYCEPRATALLLVPKSTFGGWSAEAALWGRHFNNERTGIDFVPLDERTSKEDKIAAFTAWYDSGGVIVIGYESFVALQKAVERGVHVVPAAGAASAASPTAATANGIATSQGAGTAGISGGGAGGFPLFHSSCSIDLLVCDEAHRLKAHDSQIAVAIKKLNARRRLLLTGTPLQNHLMEYWAMVDVAVPKFFDRCTFRRYFLRPISQSMHRDADPSVVALAKKRTFILIKELEPLVQRRDVSLLKKDLPPLTEIIVTLPLTPVQQDLYLRFIDIMQRLSAASTGGATGFNVLQAFAIAQKICAHPLLLFSSADAVGNTVGAPSVPVAAAAAQQAHVDLHADVEDVDLDVVASSAASFRALLTPPPGYESRSDQSAKLNVAIHLMLTFLRQNEKVLIFSVSVKFLDLIETMIRQTGVQYKNNPDLIPYLRIDGGTDTNLRQARISAFQKEGSRYGVFLISTLAGGVGITLTAASRVIIMDCAWNPSHDRQAVGRAYRFGQKRPVFVYRLVCHGTIEHRVFDQKVAKEWLFHTIVDNSVRKRDELRGVKLARLFCSPLTTVRSPKCDASITAAFQGDPCLQCLRREDIVQCIAHDSLLEEDPDTYGEEENRSYRDFLEHGGLDGTSEEENVVFRQREDEVRAQGRSLHHLLSNLLAKKVARQQAVRAREGGQGASVGAAGGALDGTLSATALGPRNRPAVIDPALASADAQCRLLYGSSVSVGSAPFSATALVSGSRQQRFASSRASQLAPANMRRSVGSSVAVTTTAAPVTIEIDSSDDPNTPRGVTTAATTTRARGLALANGSMSAFPETGTTGPIVVDVDDNSEDDDAPL